MTPVSTIIHSDNHIVRKPAIPVNLDYTALYKIPALYSTDALSPTKGTPHPPNTSFLNMQLPLTSSDI